MIVTKAHRIKLNPTPEQEQYFWRAAGIARQTWNWGLAQLNDQVDRNRQAQLPSQKCPINNDYWNAMKRAYTFLKPAYTREVTTWAVQGAFADLRAAYRGYWKKFNNGTLRPAKKPRRDGRPNGWPTFKVKNHTTPAFYLANIAIRLDGHFINFDMGRVGPVNMAEEFRFAGGCIQNGRISYRQGQWWLSISVDVEHKQTCGAGAVGVDLGVKYLAVTSDGQVADNPRPLRKALRKLRRVQRKLDRQRRANNPDRFDEKGRFVKGTGEKWHESARMKKTRAQLTKIHARIANVRNDAAHQLTTDIVRANEVIVIEDLNIRGMMSNRKLAKDIADAAMYEKRRQLEYKAAQSGAVVVPVSRWFPSSKLCSGCGWIYAGLKLSEREWTCRACGQVNHRDGNAAVNLLNEGLRILQGK